MPIDFKGKSYTTVAERIVKFKKDHKGKYSVATHVVKLEDGLCLIKAQITVNIDGDNHVYTGHAYEREGNSFINKTSYIENCETSAIGRALAAAGYGGDEYCSADELTNALKQQNPQSKNKVETTNCTVCKREVNDGVYDYSMMNFGKSICYDCQQNYKG